MSVLVGNIASLVTQPHFKAKFGIDHLSEDEYANTKGWIVSITTAGAVFGCLGVCWFRLCSWSGNTDMAAVPSDQRSIRSTMDFSSFDAHIYRRNSRSRTMQREPVRALCFEVYRGLGIGRAYDCAAYIYFRGMHS